MLRGVGKNLQCRRESPGSSGGRQTAGGEIGGNSEIDEAGRDGGLANDQIGAATAQGNVAQARAERLAYDDRMLEVGPGLIATGTGSGQEIDIAGDSAVSLPRRGIEFIGIEGIGMPDVAL